MTETVVEVHRLVQAVDATALIGTPVGVDLDPTVKSPRDGDRLRFVDAGQTVALVTRLEPGMRGQLRRVVLGASFGQGVARHGRSMGYSGATFGYAPRKAIARQEGCRLTSFGRDNEDGERLLEELAADLSAEFTTLLPEQADADNRVLSNSVLNDWRLNETSLWTSGVINNASVLPYHRDDNNLDTWSAMPTLRYGMAGGHLHVPEYGIVFPCGDGDVTWFYGRGLVHGVTPMRERKPDAYRYSLVFYALRGMVNCGTYAAETVHAARKRTEREKRLAAEIRAAVPGAEAAALSDLVSFARAELDLNDIEPWADLLARLRSVGELDVEQAAWLVALYNSYDDLGSAWQVFNRWPSPAAWAAAPDRDDARQYPCTQERRGLRGGKVVKRHESYVEQLGGMTQMDWLSKPLTGDAEADFAALTTHLRSVWGVGRQSAFEWAEFAGKALDVPVRAADAQLWGSEGPRRSLQRLYGNPDPTVDWLNDRAAECRRMLAAHDARLSWEDFETVICDFNVMRDGRYYPGRHLAALREEIDTLPPPARSVVLGEFQRMTPWGDVPPGIDKRLLGVYRDTGRIPTPWV